MDFYDAWLANRDRKLRESEVTSNQRLREAHAGNLAEQLRQSQALFPMQQSALTLQMDAARREEAAKKAMQPYADVTSIAGALGEGALADPNFRHRVAEMYGKPERADLSVLPEQGGTTGIDAIKGRTRFNRDAMELSPIMEAIVGANKPGAREGAAERAKAEGALPSRIAEVQANLTAALEQIRTRGAIDEKIAGMPAKPHPDTTRNDVLGAALQSATGMLGKYGPLEQAANDAAAANDPTKARMVLRDIDTQLKTVEGMRDIFKSTMPGGVDPTQVDAAYNRVRGMLAQLYSQLYGKFWGPQAVKAQTPSAAAFEYTQGMTP